MILFKESQKYIMKYLNMFVYFIQYRLPDSNHYFFGLARKMIVGRQITGFRHEFLNSTSLYIYTVNGIVFRPLGRVFENLALFYKNIKDIFFFKKLFKIAINFALSTIPSTWFHILGLSRIENIIPFYILTLIIENNYTY